MNQAKFKILIQMEFGQYCFAFVSQISERADKKNKKWFEESWRTTTSDNETDDDGRWRALHRISPVNYVSSGAENLAIRITIEYGHLLWESLFCNIELVLQKSKRHTCSMWIIIPGIMEPLSFKILLTSNGVYYMATERARSIKITKIYLSLLWLT